MDIITRAEAKAQGLTYYFTGKPCKNGRSASTFSFWQGRKHRLGVRDE